MPTTEELTRYALDETKRGGDPIKAQAYATLILAMQVKRIADALTEELRGEKPLDQIATALRGIELQARR
jgi:hypothetical protein